MTESIWIAIIGVAGVISTAASGVVIAVVARQSRTVKSVRDQVQNSHITDAGDHYNLRDNIDDNQNELLAAVGRVSEALGIVRGDVTGMKKDIGRLDDRDLAHSNHHERVDEKLGGLGDKLDSHLEWSRDYVAGQDR